MTTSVMVAFSDRVQSAVFWLAGGLTSEGWAEMEVAWPYFAVGFLLAVVLIRPLDRLALGDDVAESLGARPRTIRLGGGARRRCWRRPRPRSPGCSLPRAGRSRTSCGWPAGRAAHRFVVPASALAGAALLLAGDTLARVVLAPIELPVGPFMVLLGVPLFLWLLRRAM